MTRAEPLFAYGTLLDDATFARVTRCEPSPLVRATLKGWRRFDVPGAAYPGAIPVVDSSHIDGGLRSVYSQEQWRALDSYEGAEYARVSCVVETRHGPVSAFVYRFELSANLLVLVSDCPFTFETFAATRSTCSDRLTQSCIAQINGVTVGAIEIETLATGHTAWLKQLYVTSTLRGLGIGRILVERTLETLKQRGTEFVYALADVGKPHLLALGFSSAGSTDDASHRPVFARRL